MASPDIIRAYVLHVRLLIRGQSDHKPGCDSGDTSTPKCHSGGAQDPAHPRDGVVVPVPLDKCDDYFSLRSNSAWAKKLRPT